MVKHCFDLGRGNGAVRGILRHYSRVASLTCSTDALTIDDTFCGSKSRLPLVVTIYEGLNNRSELFGSTLFPVRSKAYSSGSLSALLARSVLRFARLSPIKGHLRFTHSL
jgi:hypothetical protein